MFGIEPRSSDAWIDRSASCTTTFFAQVWFGWKIDTTLQKLPYRVFKLFKMSFAPSSIKLYVWLTFTLGKNTFLSLETAIVRPNRGIKIAFLKNEPFPPSFFFIFVFLITVDSKCSIYFLPMTGFEPRTSGIGSDCSTNWATTTAPKL